MKIKMMVLIFLMLVALKANSYEYNINRYNETLIVFNFPVLGVNCTPASFGKIIGVEGIQNSSTNFFLRLVPNKKEGDLFCSFKLANKELIDIKFNLGDFIKTPVVDVARLEKEKENNQEIEQFVSFSRGERNGFKDIIRASSIGKLVKGEKNTYKINELFVSPDGLYFYVFEILTGSTDRFFKLNNFESNSLQFSTLIQHKDKAELILSSYKPIAFKRVLP